MNRLKEIREARGLTQAQVADILGITFSGYSMIERGKRKVKAEYLVRLSNYYNVTIDYLLGRKPDKTIETDITNEKDFTKAVSKNFMMELGKIIREAYQE